MTTRKKNRSAWQASVAVAEAAGEEDLLTQFQVNWKTFASYTQDLLRQTMKELEQAPERDVNELRERVELALEELVRVRTDVSRVHDEVNNPTNTQGELFAQALVDIKKEISTARGEFQSSSENVVGQVTTALSENLSVPQPTLDSDALVASVEERFSSVRSDLSAMKESVAGVTAILATKSAEEVERRVRSGISNAETDWNQRAVEFHEKLNEANQRNEQLTQETEDLKDLQNELQEEFRQVTQRESALKEQLASSHAQAAEAQLAGDTAAQREESLSAELAQSQAEQKKVSTKAAALERSIIDLQKTVDELRTNEKNSKEQWHTRQKEAEELRATEIEARFLEDLRRKEETWGHKQKELRTEVQRLERTVEASKKGDSTESQAAELLQNKCNALQKALDATRRACEALKDERAHLEEESQRLLRESQDRSAQETAQLQTRKNELAQLRDEHSAKESQLRQQQAQSESQRQTIDRLQATVADQRAELAQQAADYDELSRNVDSTRSRHSHEEVEDLQRSLQETNNELRSSLQEKFRLKTKITEVEAEWQSRLNTLELQIAEAERERSDAKRRLSESSRTISDLKLQLEALRCNGHSAEQVKRSEEQARLSDEHAQRSEKDAKGLRQEKAELARSLELAQNELAKATQKAGEVQPLERFVFRSATVGAVVLCREDLTVSQWNPGAEELWNRKANEVMGKRFVDLDVPGLSQLAPVVEEALAGGQKCEPSDVSFTDDAGSTRHLRISIEPVNTGENKDSALIVAHDVTEEVEKDLEARLQSLFSESLTESIPAALVVLDSRDRITSWNRHAEEMFGISTEETLGRELFTLDTPLHRSAFRKRFDKIKEQGTTQKFRLRLGLKDTLQKCLLTQCPFQARDKTVRGTLLVIEPGETTTKTGKDEESDAAR